MITRRYSSGLDSDAVILGWQEMLSGKLVAHYHSSTVTDSALLDLNLQIPDQSQSKRNKKGNPLCEIVRTATEKVPGRPVNLSIG